MSPQEQRNWLRNNPGRSLADMYASTNPQPSVTTPPPAVTTPAPTNTNSTQKPYGTLNDLAIAGYTNQFSDPQAAYQRALALAKDGKISIEDLNNTFKSTQAYTQSGSQGSGRTGLNDLYFNKDGTIASEANSIYDNNWASENAAEIEAAKLKDNYLSYSELSQDQLNNLVSGGLYTPTDSRQQFVSTDAKDAKNYGYSDVDLSSGYINQNDLAKILSGSVNRQSELIRNTGQKASDGWLLGDGLGTLFSAAGSMLGVPFLSLAGNVVNTGRAAANGDIGSALMGGIGMYNTAGSIANSAATAYGPAPADTRFYDSFNPSQYIAQDVLGIENNTLGEYVGNAARDSAVAVLDGNNVGDALRQSLINTTGSNIGSALGLPSWVSSMAVGGLPYLFNDSNGGNNTTTTPPGQTTTPTPTTNTQQPFNPPAGLAASPYTITNPTGVPTYTNPFEGVASPYTNNYSQPLTAQYEEDVDDESDTENPYTTAVNYGGSGQGVYG